MLIFFYLLALINLVLTGLTLYFGLTGDLLMHFYFGLVTVVSALVVHCWVFFYFIGTGEGIREGILENNLDQAPIKATKKFKAKTFPFALFAMIFLIVTAVMGGALRTERVTALTHTLWAIFALAFNAFTLWQESRIIGINQKLMRDLNEQVAQKQSGQY